MSTRAKTLPDAASMYEPATVGVRVKLSGLWTAMLFVFAYVDLFSLYRADVRADLEAGEVGGFAVSQSFLLATTAYVVLPAVMVFGCLALPARLARIANLVLGVGYALTIVGGAVGDANRYYLFGSAVELALLAGVVFYAWSWPKAAAPEGTSRALPADQRQPAAT